MSNNTFDIVIVGSGPAGWTAAIYASRADLKCLVLEGEQPGGQLTITTDVENYPGFPEGIMGPEMMQRFGEQAKRFGTEVKQETVTEVDFSGPPHKVVTKNATYESKAVIIASGARAKLLGLESESRLMGHGVSACATCDGFFFRGKEIAVVGGGDSAIEESHFLTKFADKVTIIHRRDKLRASKIMQKRAFDNPKIDFLWHSVVTDVIGDTESGMRALQVKSTKDDSVKEMPFAGLFLAIGHEPNTEFLKGKLDMDKTGYLITHDGTKTSVDGVFACGDVQDHIYRQAITAAGTGCMAALDAERWIEAH